jgi:acetyl-CoA carboxylase alpha subunit
MSEAIKNALVAALAELKALPADELVKRRREKLANFGNYREG